MTLAIPIQLRTENAHERVKSLLPIEGRIHVVINDSCFPHDEWDDFPIVLLGCWLQRTRAIANHEADVAVLTFMDGPYAIHITSIDESHWRLEGIVRSPYKKLCFQVTCSPETVLESIRTAGSRSLNQARGMDLWDPDCAILAGELRIR